MELNDELLSAYLDNALDEDQQAAVSAALATDAGARLRLERMQAADRALRASLPLPQGDKFEAMMTARIQMGRSAPRWQRTVLPWALAASVAGLVAGYMLPREQSPAGLSAPDAVLARVLDEAPSGDVAGQGTSVVLSFQAGDGRYCRLFRAARDAGSGEGLACRGTAGWQVVAWDATTTTSTEGFRAAGAGMLIDGAMSELGGRPAMDAGEEVAAIKRGWSKP
ncbi:MAG: hypothetical protein IPM70_00305 [Proteobacteria bacterium]|jgi:hypothetical protein|nr:hypothetical protein [Pseudomonadota bacterium]MBK9250392.1 hypothetical protein [Pseudomonadota bacterium]